MTDHSTQESGVRYRRLGKTGYKVSEIGFGAWAIGGDWGPVDDEESMRALHAAVDAGVTFFDTADVYGDGRSERLLARLRDERPSDELVIATKCGAPASGDAREYTPENLFEWIDRSRVNLRSERLDLVQLHCPPTDVYYHPEVFSALDALVATSVIASYGVSIQRVEEGLKALEYPGLGSIQVIFNLFRQRPAERLLHLAMECDVGIIARVPLASGLLTGKLKPDAAFAEDDHRSFNRQGVAFDVGETFSGIDLEIGTDLVTQVAERIPEGASLAQLALKWVLMHDNVSTTIPGAKTPAQVIENAAASDLDDLGEVTMEALRWLYDDQVAPLVHHRW